MRFSIVIASLLLLGGCEVMAGAEGASAVVSGKSFSDHIISLSSGKDCSTVRTQNGQNYCVEDDVAEPQNIHCYRTLGKVTCYDKPDPHKGRHQKVGENLTVLPKKKTTNPFSVFR